MPLAGENELSALTKDPQAMIRVPIGAVSPLWGLFAGAAISGAAWWWMIRWARPANLEAAFGAVDTAAGEVEAAPAAEAVSEASAALEPLVEAAEAAMEKAPPAPVAEAIIEDAPLAVGGEAAPISPVLEAQAPDVVEPEPGPADQRTVIEAAPAPKPAPRPKKAPPKAD